MANQSTTYTYYFKVFFFDFIPNDNINDFVITNIKGYISDNANIPIINSDNISYQVNNSTNTYCIIPIETSVDLTEVGVNTLYFEITGKYGASSKTPITTPRFAVNKTALQNSADISEEESNKEN